MSRVSINDQYLTDIGDGIRAKLDVQTQYKPSQMKSAILSIPGASTLVSKTINQNGNYDPADDNADGYSGVFVDVPQSGGGSVAPNAVNFFDYDGMIVASYSAADFANLTALPANPSHDGLTAQGWNWTLADAKTYVASYGRLDIGQMYITTDGKTNVHIRLEQGRTSPMLGVCPNGTVDVDWGDGTAHDTLTGTSTSTVKWTQTHNYAAPGYYVIKLTVTGSMGFYGNSSSNQYSGLLRYSSTGDNRNYVYRNAIRELFVGSGVTSIMDNAFNNCYNLAIVTIPNNVTSIGSKAFSRCYGLSNIVIPNSVTSIGSDAFTYCYGLSNIEIPNSVTSIGADAFYYCYNLASVVIPSSITSIADYEFSYCNSLAIVTIPNNVTSIKSNAFYYCYSLANVTIPNSVTSIGSDAFYCCYSLGEIHFKSETPPTVSNSSVWYNIPTDCKIYVPTGSLSAYTSARNYPNSASYSYVEE